MILTDAGAMYALVNTAEGEAHRRCRTVLNQGENSRLLTTWPCFAEAMYLLYRAGGWAKQRLLWKLVLQGVIVFHALTPSDHPRMIELMEKYRDTPMDLADATLVVAAEALGLNRIFTLDGDFTVYRIHGKTPFDVLP